jgi:hypothetical protein
VEGYLVGLALVDKRCQGPGTALSVFPLRGKSLREGLIQEKKIALPVDVTVLTRFPEKDGDLPRWVMAED